MLKYVPIPNLFLSRFKGITTQETYSSSRIAASFEQGRGLLRFLALVTMETRQNKDCVSHALDDI